MWDTSSTASLTTGDSDETEIKRAKLDSSSKSHIKVHKYFAYALIKKNKTIIIKTM